MSSCGGMLIADDFEDPRRRGDTRAAPRRRIVAPRRRRVAGLDGAALTDILRARLHDRLHGSPGGPGASVDAN